jgi:hypothetical protein
MSFYVTLPSDTRQGPGNNTKHNYTTFFSPAITIPTPYEVALTDFTFAQQMRVVYGSMRLKCSVAGRTLYSESRAIEHPDKHDYKELVDELNRLSTELTTEQCCGIVDLLDEIQAEVKRDDIRAYHEADSLYAYVVDESSETTRIAIVGPQNMVDTVDADILKVIEQANVLLKLTGNTILYTRTSTTYEGVGMYRWSVPAKVAESIIEKLSAHTIHHTEPGVVSLRGGRPQPTLLLNNSSTITPQPSIAKLDGWFGKPVSYSIMLSGPIAELLTGSKYEAELVGSYTLPENPQLVHSLLVYTDIIEEQFYGGQKLQVLHTHRLVEDKGHVMLESPHYLNVNKSCISSINIRIHDREGNPVKFTDKFQHVEVKLHFKPR